MCSSTILFHCFWYKNKSLNFFGNNIFTTYCLYKSYSIYKVRVCGICSDSLAQNWLVLRKIYIFRHMRRASIIWAYSLLLQRMYANDFIFFDSSLRFNFGRIYGSFVGAKWTVTFSLGKFSVIVRLRYITARSRIRVGFRFDKFSFLFLLHAFFCFVLFFFLLYFTLRSNRPFCAQRSLGALKVNDFVSRVIFWIYVGLKGWRIRAKSISLFVPNFIVKYFVIICTEILFRYFRKLWHILVNKHCNI